MRHFFTLLLAGALLLTSNAGAGVSVGNTYTEIDQETARRMMDADDGHVIVDVRRRDEYDAGHIPDAILIPNETIGCDAPEALPDYDQVILIYCRSGNRSKQAAQKLASMGYTNVYEFGGILTWPGPVVTTEEEQAGRSVVLRFSTFAGGGPEYSAVIEDESILSCEVSYDSFGMEGEIIDGAAYDVIFAFTGLQPGMTTVTLQRTSPMLDYREEYYMAHVGGDLRVEMKEGTAMKVQIRDKAYTALLEDNETARAFASLLPMELHMTELNGNEKYHYLMGSLPSAPAGIGHIEAGDIMLFGDDCVVLFYQSFDTPYSYTRIGRIISADGLAEQLGGGDADVRFAPAD